MHFRAFFSLLCCLVSSICFAQTANVTYQPTGKGYLRFADKFYFDSGSTLTAPLIQGELQVTLGPVYGYKIAAGSTYTINGGVPQALALQENLVQPAATAYMPEGLPSSGMAGTRIRIPLNDGDAVVFRPIFEPLSQEVAITHNGFGTVTPNSATFLNGQTISLTATPQPGYAFAYWSFSQQPGRFYNLAGLNLREASTIFTLQAEAPVGLQAFFLPSRTITIAAGQGGTVTPNGVLPYVEGVAIQLQAQPQPGYLFSSWTQTGVGFLADTQDPGTIFIVGNQDASLTANFVEQSLITTVAQSGGTVTPSGTTALRPNQDRLLAIPATNQRFLFWEGNTDFIDNPNSANPLVTKAGTGTLIAVFEPQTYTISINTSAGGTVSPSSPSQVLVGSKFTATATADAGKVFFEWRGTVGTRAFSSSKNPVEFSIENNTSLTAYFADAQTLTSTINGDGAIYLNSSPLAATQTVPLGGIMELKALERPNSGFDGWVVTGPCSISDTAAATTTLSVGGNCSITANFSSRILLDIAPYSSGGNTSPSGVVKASIGDNLIATPLPGYRFHSWAGDTQFITSAATAETTLTGGRAFLRAVFMPQMWSYTATAGVGGTVVPTTGADRQGTQLSFTATAKEGYTFKKWTGTGITTANESNPTVAVTLNSDVNLNAEFATTQYTLTIQLMADNAQFDVITYSLPANSDFNIPDLRSYAPQNMAFLGWGGPDVNAIVAVSPDFPSSSIKMTSNKTIRALFTPLVTLTTTHSGPGRTNVSMLSSTYVVPRGTVVDITVLPEDGSYFINWDGVDAGAVIPVSTALNTYRITMNSDKEITAVFMPLYTLTVSTPNGSTDLPLNRRFTPGTVVTLTATPDIPYVFTNWSGDVQSNLATVSVIMDRNKSITANFVKQQHTLVVSTVGGGTTNYDGINTIPSNTLLTLVPTPSPGNAFAFWSGRDVAYLKDPKRAEQLINVARDLNLVANFTTQNATVDVRVCIQPEGADVFWRLSNANYTTPWLASCQEVTDVPAGSYDLLFTPLTGWVPPNRIIELGAYKKNDLTASYYTQASTNYFLLGSKIKLTATRSQGYEFDKWTGFSADELQPPNSNVTTLVLNGPKEVHANFVERNYTLTIFPINKLTGEVIGTPAVETFQSGQRVDLGQRLRDAANRITTPGKWYPSEWFGPGFTGDANFYRALPFWYGEVGVTMTRDQVVFSNFIPNLQVTVTYSSGGTIGNYTSGQVIDTPYGSNVILYETDSCYSPCLVLPPRPALGNVVSNASGTILNFLPNPNNLTSLILRENATFHIDFEERSYSVRIRHRTSPNSTPLVDTTATYPSGQRVNFSAPQNYGDNIFYNWTDEGGSEFSNNRNIDFNVNRNYDLTANYQSGYVLTVKTRLLDSNAATAAPNSVATTDIGGGGINSADFTVGLVKGLSQTVTAVAQIGYEFAYWEGAVADTTKGTTTVSMDQNKTITAVFRTKTFTLRVKHLNRGDTPDTLVDVPARATINVPYLSNSNGYTLHHWEGPDHTLLKLPDCRFSGDLCNEEPMRHANTDNYEFPTNPTQRLAVTRDMEVHAVYAPIRYLTINPAHGGEVRRVAVLSPWRFVESTGRYCTPNISEPLYRQQASIFGRVDETCVTQWSNIALPDQAILNLEVQTDKGINFEKWVGLDEVFYGVNAPLEQLRVIPYAQIKVDRNLNVYTIFSAVDSPIQEGLILWLNNEDLPAAGSKITSWVDRSERQRTAVQPVERLRPTVVKQVALANQNVARFDGDDTLNYPEITDGRTFFVVAYNADRTPRSLFGHTSSTDLAVGTEGVLYSSNAVSRMLTAYNNLEQGFPTNPRPPKIITFVTADFLKTNRVTGQPGNPLFWVGDIGEMLVYNRVLNPNEIQSVLSYLYGKFFGHFHFEQSWSFGGQVTPLGKYTYSQTGSFVDHSYQNFRVPFTITATPNRFWEFHYWDYNSSNTQLANPNAASTTAKITTNTIVNALFREQLSSLSVEIGGVSDPLLVDILKSRVSFMFRGVYKPLWYPDDSGLAVEKGAILPPMINLGNAYPASAGTQQAHSLLARLGVMQSSLPSNVKFSHFTVNREGSLDDPYVPDGYANVYLNPEQPTVVTAHFVKVDANANYTVSVASAGNGTVSPVGTNTYAGGTVLPLVATPAPGYVFDYWSGSNPASVGDWRSANTSLIVSQDTTLTAHFAPERVALTVFYTQGGRVEYNGNLIEGPNFNVTKGSSVTLTAVPQQGFLFWRWVGSGTSQLANTTSPVQTFTANTPLQLEAQFRKDYSNFELFKLSIVSPFDVATHTLRVLPDQDYFTHMADPYDANKNLKTEAQLAPLPRVTFNNPAGNLTVNVPVIEVDDDHVTPVDSSAFYVPGNILRVALLRFTGDPIDGVADLPDHSSPITGSDTVPTAEFASRPANAESFQFTTPAGDATLANVFSSWIISSSGSGNPRTYLKILSPTAVGGTAGTIEFSPPPGFSDVVTITYWVADNNPLGARGNQGRLDPENKRTKRSNCVWTATSVICQGQIVLRPAQAGEDVDPMQQGVQARVLAGSIWATPALNSSGSLFSPETARSLYDYHINDIYPNGETVSGVSAHYILRTIACYFIPGRRARNEVSYSCDASGSFEAVPSSYCDSPATYGYSRCVSNYCNYYSYVPANITCKPASTTITGSNGAVTLNATTRMLTFSSQADYLLAKASGEVSLNGQNSGKYKIESFNDSTQTVILAGTLNTDATSASNGLAVGLNVHFLSLLGTRVDTQAGGTTCLKLACPLRNPTTCVP